MTIPITVSFCCNDSNGNNSGSFISMEFEAIVDGVSHDLCVSARDIDEEIALKFLDPIDVIEVAGERHHIVNCSHKRYVGNMAWDSVEMDEQDARRLLKWLGTASLIETDSCDIGHPFEELAP